MMSVFHRQGSSKDPAGSQNIRAAFDEKDLDALASVLKQYPEAWQTDLCYLDSGHGIRYDGPCSFMAIHRGWTAALPLLHAAGDPMTGKHPDTGRTVMQYAVYKGQASAVRKLLSLGVSTGEAEGTPALAGLTGANVPNAKAIKVIDVLLKAGANPWGMVGEEPLPAPIALLRWENVELASYLAQHGKAPTVPDDGTVFSLWKNSFRRHGTYKHICLLDALHDQNMAPNLTDFARLLPGASRTSSVYSSTESEADVIVALMEHRIKLGVCAQDMREARPFLEGVDLAGPVRAIVEREVLDDQVPEAPSVRRTPRL